MHDPDRRQIGLRHFDGEPVGGVGGQDGGHDLKSRLKDHADRLEASSRADELVEVASRHAASLDEPALDLVLTPIGEGIADADGAESLQCVRLSKTTASAISTYRTRSDGRPPTSHADGGPPDGGRKTPRRR